jgi:hypothetical protein
MGVPGKIRQQLTQCPARVRLCHQALPNEHGMEARFLDPPQIRDRFDATFAYGYTSAGHLRA